MMMEKLLGFDFSIIHCFLVWHPQHHMRLMGWTLISLELDFSRNRGHHQLKCTKFRVVLSVISQGRMMYHKHLFSGVGFVSRERDRERIAFKMIVKWLLAKRTSFCISLLFVVVERESDDICRSASDESVFASRIFRRSNSTPNTSYMF